MVVMKCLSPFVKADVEVNEALSITRPCNICKQTTHCDNVWKCKLIAIMNDNKVLCSELLPQSDQFLRPFPPYQT